MSHKAAVKLLKQQLAERNLTGYADRKSLDGQIVDFMWRDLRMAVKITTDTCVGFSCDWLVYLVTPNFVLNDAAIQMIQMLIKQRRLNG